MVSENRALLKTLVETQAKMIKMQEEKFQMETEMRQVRIEMQEAKQMLSQVNETVKRLGGTQPLTAERGNFHFFLKEREYLHCHSFYSGSSMTGMTSVNFAQPASSSSAADLVGSNNDQSSKSSRLRKMILF